MIDILVVRSNPIINSPRVTKIVTSLSRKYNVRALGWNRANLPSPRFNDYVVDLDILKMRGPIGRYLLAIYLPIFWLYVLYKLIKHSPKIIHACDLDAVPPSFLYKILFRRKVVFDVCDRYAMSKISRNHVILYSIVNRLEEFYAGRVDCLINVSERLEKTFAQRPATSTVIMNCADNRSGDQRTKRSSTRVDGETFNELNPDGVKHDLALVYTGNIIRRRGLEQIADVIRNMESVELMIAGKAVDEKLLHELSAMKNVKYHGYLSLSKALELEATCDVMMILYDPYNPNNIYAMPNKLFESMMFGLPLITNIAPEIVKRAKCGINVDYHNIEQIKNAVLTLRDDHHLRRTLGRNGRIAFGLEYNWKNMEERLYEVYRELLKVDE